MAIRREAVSLRTNRDAGEAPKRETFILGVFFSYLLLDQIADLDFNFMFGFQDRVSCRNFT